MHGFWKLGKIRPRSLSSSLRPFRRSSTKNVVMTSIRVHEGTSRGANSTVFGVGTYLEQKDHESYRSRELCE